MNRQEMTPDHASRMAAIRQAIEEGRRNQMKVFTALERETQPKQPRLLQSLSPDELSALVLTNGQVEQVEKTRELIVQMCKLIEAVNTINGAFGLGLPPLLGSELAVHLNVIDRRIGQAREAARLAGMSEVAKKIGTVQARQRPTVKYLGNY